MVLLNLCSNLYFPFLTYLANLKGLCTGATIPSTPIITYPTTIIINTTAPATTARPPSTTTTLRPITILCPAIPLACLAGGISPIVGCPCIDPRQTNIIGGFGVVNGVLTQLPQTNPFPTTLAINNGLPTTLIPQNPFAQPPPPLNPLFLPGSNVVARSPDSINQSLPPQRSSNLLNSPQQEILNDPDVMIFASLGKKRRRKKRDLN